jgi:hypothetical protein
VRLARVTTVPDVPKAAHTIAHRRTSTRDNAGTHKPLPGTALSHIVVLFTTVCTHLG